MGLFRVTEFGDYWSVVLTQDGELVKGVIALLRSRDNAERLVSQLDELSSHAGVEYRVSVCHPGAVQIPGVIINATNDDGKEVAMFWLTGLDVEEPALLESDVDYAPVLPVDTLHDMPGFSTNTPYPQSLDALQRQLT